VRLAIAAALAALILSACRVADGPEVASGSTPTVCDVTFQAPAGFSTLDTFHEEYADHIGIRIGFEDGRGREVHAFAGIPGEFGEGMPAAGELEISPGRLGSLSGADRVWVLEWAEGGPCDPRAALGNGFSREGFIALLQEAGIVAGSG